MTFRDWNHVGKMRALGHQISNVPEPGTPRRVNFPRCDICGRALRYDWRYGVIEVWIDEGWEVGIRGAWLSNITCAEIAIRDVIK